jgi:hypothetical protein
MVTVCAWCERYLGSTMDAGPMVTHGICQPCLARQKWADAPVIVVSRNRADIHAVLEHLLHGEPAVRIVMDRRVGDRRQRGAEPASARERRRGPDRRRRPADAILI